MKTISIVGVISSKPVQVNIANNVPAVLILVETHKFGYKQFYTVLEISGICPEVFENEVINSTYANVALSGIGDVVSIEVEVDDNGNLKSEILKFKNDSRRPKNIYRIK